MDDAITKRLEKGVFNLIHHNTAKFLRFVERFAKGSKDYKLPEYKRYALMLYYALFKDILKNTDFNNINEALELLHEEKYKSFNQEVKEIVAYLLENLKIKTKPLNLEFCPLL